MPPRFLIPAACFVFAACGAGNIRPAEEPGSVGPAPSPAPSPPVAEPATPAAPAPSADPSADAPQPDTVPELRRIGRWTSSGIKGARRLVIRDAQTWSRFWSELGAGVRPEVDFGRDLVIAVASGTQSTGGHDIAVERVLRSGGELRIEVVETSPGPSCLTSAALTQPVDVVTVPSEGVTGWSFIDRHAVRPC